MQILYSHWKQPPKRHTYASKHIQAAYTLRLLLKYFCCIRRRRRQLLHSGAWCTHSWIALYKTLKMHRPKIQVPCKKAKKVLKKLLQSPQWTSSKLKSLLTTGSPWHTQSNLGSVFDLCSLVYRYIGIHKKGIGRVGVWCQNRKCQTSRLIFSGQNTWDVLSFYYHDMHVHTCGCVPWT